MANAGNKRTGQQAKPRPRARQAAKRDTFPWINSQIIAVSESGELPRLITTIEAYLPQMNLVNISTALHRLAKLAGSPQDGQAQLGDHPVIQALIESACQALARARAGGASPSSQALSNITWSLATLQVVDEPLLQAIAVPSAENVTLFKPFELSALLWAYAKLGSLEPGCADCGKMLFEVAASYIPDHVQEFTFRCLVTTVWSFATARQGNAPLFKAVAMQMVGTVHSASCQELANTAWAFGVMGVHHDKLFQELAKRGGQRLDEFKPPELFNLLWGFAANGFFHQAFFQGAALAVRRMDLQAQQLTHLLWAVTRARPRHSTTSAAVLALLPECTRQINTFKPQEIASVALAAAKAFGRGEERAPRAPGGRGQGLPQQVADFFEASLPLALPQPRGFSGQSLASLATAFLAVRAQGAVVLLAAVGREVMGRIKTLETSVLLHLIRAFAFDLSPLFPPIVLQEGCRNVAMSLFGEIARRVDTLRPRELQVLSRLCSGPLGLSRRSDLSPQELRSCCFALASGHSAPMQGNSLEELLEALRGYPEASGAESLDSEETWDGSPASSGAPLFGKGDGMVPKDRRGGGQSSRGQASRHRPPVGPTLLPARRGQTPKAVVEGPDCRFVCKVKNTFLHVECSDAGSEAHESDEDSTSSNGDAKKGINTTSMAAVLGPPLQFLPKDIELDELQAYRADYQAFRAGQATGARGEISDLCPSGQQDPEAPWYGNVDRLVASADTAGRQWGLCR